ncbi:kinase-like domain-containing protein [Chaetomium strumarium]|uniref:Kinase-like domain-containing protein n=1 Tax=Chaetomium strumarium TaxID=1170767 RepID=A0AAJ0GN65_9PEZI|nr:kinase-like domain-containing protein [Chaetomium strumarium]
MADRNEDSSRSPISSGSADPAHPDNKRDREYGMYPDRLFIHKYRPGIPQRFGRIVRGSYNAIFPLFFTDGTAAALRVALPGVNAFPDEKVRVEVATMRYIEKMTSIPVPHVYHWSTADENPLGLGAFIIMDYVHDERSLASVLKDPTAEEPEQYLDPNIPTDKLERMYRQLASSILELSKLEMPKIGSLHRPLTVDMNELVKSGGIPPSEWYEALADMHVAHLTFQRNSAVESADDGRDKFVARHLFRQAAAKGQQESQRAGQETFKLWVDDLRPQNVLVDAGLNIVAVIDWEWAYFAPAQFVYDPPYWLLLERPEFWYGTVLEWRDKFSRVLDVFCRALRSLEEEQKKGDGEEEEWSITEHILALSLDPETAAQTEETPVVPLSERMRESWKSGTFWEDYAARRCYGFDPIFWEFLDERFFGKNAEGGYEGRMNLLSDKVRRRMHLFVDRKMEESKEERIEEWDPEAARIYLGDILLDLS